MSGCNCNDTAATLCKDCPSGVALPDEGSPLNCLDQSDWPVAVHGKCDLGTNRYAYEPAGLLPHESQRENAP